MPLLKNLPMRIILFAGSILGLCYILFRASYINFSPYLVGYSILLFIAEFHTILLLFGMLYSLWPRKYEKFEKINKDKNLQVNLFITVAGEPFEIVKDTILSAKKAANYYNQKINPIKPARVIVLNDGKSARKKGWGKISQYAEELGIYHLERSTNKGYKAGNINNGLKKFPSDDPHNTIDCFLDADFSAKERFLVELLKPLQNKNIDFVQSPQRYKNNNTWVAKAAAAHQIFFFEYICPAKGYDNALFLCGTNYAIRREALLEAGGVDSRFVTEDYATSIRLHILGKKGVFIPKVLALGLAPMNLKEYFNQQTRWCKGCLDANRKNFKQLFFGPLNLRQKFHYFISTAYYFIGVRDLILVLAPLPFLFFDVSLIRTNTLSYLFLIYFPLLASNFILFFKTFKNPVKSLVLDLVAFPMFANAFLSCVFQKDLPFTITVKKYEKENPFKVYKVQLLIAIALTTGIAYSLFASQANIYGRLINYFWATYDAIFLFIGFFLVVHENYSFQLPFNFKRLAFVNSKYTYSVARFSVALGLLFLIFTKGPSLYETARISLNQYAQASGIIKQKNQSEVLLVPEKGVYYGYYLPALNSHPKSPITGLIKNEKNSLVMYYQDWGGQNMFDIDYMNALSAKNVIPVITWEPWKTKDTEKGIIDQKDFYPKVISGGRYDKYIREWAKKSAAYNKPYFLRFAHEMNGDWYPWGNTKSNNAAEYKKMWVHVHDIFEEEGATNVIWVWAPNNTDSHGSSESVKSFYPGAEYVDWVAYSGFNWGEVDSSKWISFKDISENIYSILSALNKPIMVAETSSVSSKYESKSRWFSEIPETLAEMPNIKAFIIYNANDRENDFSISENEMPVIIDSIIQNSYFIKTPKFVNGLENLTQQLSLSNKSAMQLDLNSSRIPQLTSLYQPHHTPQIKNQPDYLEMQNLNPSISPHAQTTESY